MRKDLQAVLVGFLAWPLLLALTRIAPAWVSGRMDSAAVRTTLPMLGMGIAVPLAVAWAGLVWQRGLVPGRWKRAMLVGALAGEAGALALQLGMTPAPARPHVLHLSMLLGGAFSGLLSLGILLRLTTVPPLVRDPLQEAGLPSPQAYELLGRQAGGGAPSFQATSAFYRWVLWGGAVFCGALLVFTPPGEAFLFLFFLAFALLAAYAALAVGTITIDTSAVTHRHPFATYAITWNEVRTVEVSMDRKVLVLQGDDKRLSLYHPKLWSGPQSAQARQLLAEILKSRALEPQETRWAQLKLSRNVRVRLR